MLINQQTLHLFISVLVILINIMELACKVCKEIDNHWRAIICRICIHFCYTERPEFWTYSDAWTLHIWTLTLWPLALLAFGLWTYLVAKYLKLKYTFIFSGLSF